MSEKKKLRADMLSLRKSMSEDEVKSKSEAICKTIARMKLTHNYEDVLLYYPVNNEVDLRYLFPVLTNEKKNIWLPVVNGKSMSFHLYEGEKNLKIGAYGIPEPISETIYKGMAEKAVVFMPGLAFTENKDRLGYGGGYYDKFLACQNYHTVAVAFETQIVDFIPNESFDIKPNIIVSDKRVVS